LWRKVREKDTNRLMIRSMADFTKVKGGENQSEDLVLDIEEALYYSYSDDRV
jgi:hypothetical protein